MKKVEHILFFAFSVYYCFFIYQVNSTCFRVRALSLDLIKRRLDKGLYKRLDVFQEDFFSCLERARRLSRTTSQLFEDTVEMQTYFIKQRDALCKNGELLSSPALTYTVDDATAAIRQLKQNKQLKESLEEETETRSSEDSLLLKETSLSVGESMTCNQRTFKVGEFVYIDSKEKNCEPHILVIERLFETKGQQMLYGTYYLRPAETYHLTTRKFLDREVFKSDKHVTVPLEDVRDRCCVVNVKQYYTMRPEGTYYLRFMQCLNVLCRYAVARVKLKFVFILEI